MVYAKHEIRKSDSSRPYFPLKATMQVNIKLYENPLAVVVVVVFKFKTQSKFKYYYYESGLSGLQFINLSNR